MKKYYFTILLTISLLATNKFMSFAEDDKLHNDNSGGVVRLQEDKTSEVKWRLDWEENFDGGDFDQKRWSKIPRNGAEWGRHMSDFSDCYQVKDGKLILRGLRNEHLPNDKSPYLTGGIYTKGKVNFADGRIEIRAKLGKAKGAWPAFWLLPSDNTQWPRGGEVDIMEHLNSDDFIYQTVHSNYTVNLKMIKNPPSGSKAKIDPDNYNVYAVELNKDDITFFVNDKKTFVYPRIETDKEGQFPFNREFYLLLDMQLGGSWVGEINPDNLPVEMQIDWVRFYKKEK
ncbi:MAG: glycoside hydrolase family 16 protein [Planctomycetaceae bacterium]|jgi:beta-glucanase (GH16 family)|nr:glycoside hydrolase family 16 protein [Planctomycetaceae bacterium]